MDYSVVIPCFKSPKTLRDQVKATVNALGVNSHNFEIILVCDEDSESTINLLKEIGNLDERIKIIELAKNFGQASAVTLGISKSSGEFVFTMDDDYQHNPSQMSNLINSMIDKVDVVYAIPLREKQNLIRNLFSFLFKKIVLKKVGLEKAFNFSAFRLIRRSSISESLNTSSSEYIDLVIHWSTNRIISIPVTFEERKFGKSNYTLRSLFGLSIKILFSYTDYFLKIIIRLGFIILVLSLLYAGWISLQYFGGNKSPNGFATIVVMISFYSSVQIIFLGIIGRYVAILNEKTMGKPKFIIRKE
jgi:undecaprenyl-phosphate 4-deoxy-4-formamido-L-arabinose transferase